jgi:hypothetical protein
LARFASTTRTLRRHAGIVNGDAGGASVFENKESDTSRLNSSPHGVEIVDDRHSVTVLEISDRAE